MNLPRLGTTDTRGRGNQARGGPRLRTRTAVACGTIVVSNGENMSAWSIDREKTETDSTD